jgi:threonine dehydrogenase-like Zn-dependent dehydrogenase
MKTVFKKNEQIQLRDTELPAPGPGQIRLKIDACGICGTDIHGRDDEFGKFGHEIAGTILETGEGVDYLEPGQKVVLDSATPCGRCSMCRNRRPELCTDIQSFFYMDQFGFAEEMNAPAVSAIPYSGIPPETASLQEPLGVAIDLCKTADIKSDTNVLVLGQGPIGLMAACVSRHMGADRVFVSEFGSKTARKELAESLEIDGFIDAENTRIEDYDYGCPVDRILVTSPPPTLENAVKTAAKGGIIGFIGIGYGDASCCRFDANYFHFNKLELRSSFASPALYGPLALTYLYDGVVPGEKLISHRFPLSRIEQAVKTAKDDPAALKVAVIPESPK